MRDKSKVLSISILAIFIGAIFSPCISGNMDENNDFNKLNTTSIEDNAPIWEVGDSWTYGIGPLDIEREEEGMIIDLNLQFDDLDFEVTEILADSYKLEFSTKIEGDFLIDLDNYSVALTGEFTRIPVAKIQGEIIQRKSDLGITDLDLEISGAIKLKITENPIFDFPIPGLRFPFKIAMQMSFDSTMSLLEFPIEIGNIWGLSAYELTLDGQISSIWLNIINFIDKLAGMFGIPIIPDGFEEFFPVFDIGDFLINLLGENVFPFEGQDPLFLCYDLEEITVEAGTYDAYNIIVGENYGNIYYAPDAGRIIKIFVDGELISDDFPDVDVYLKSTNYS